jgi:triosephosphate isomerase
MQKKLIVGNWKMHKTAHEAAQYVHALGDVPALLAVPFTAIAAAAQIAHGTKLQVGAQNMHEASQGAYTGEISGIMLKEAGASFVLLGHSERRSLFGETDAKLHQKIFRALEAGLLPILCVGETLEEREQGREEEVLKRQLQTALQGIDPHQVIVAYEPIWAIGTGKSASVEMIEAAHRVCRSIVGKGGRILYGGSVRLDNVAELVRSSEIDGILVGAASLDPAIFKQIIEKVLS